MHRYERNYTKRKMVLTKGKKKQDSHGIPDWVPIYP